MSQTYRGEHYEVWAKDGRGADVFVGYTNRIHGADLVMVVKRHPVWHSPTVIEVEAQDDA